MPQRVVYQVACTLDLLLADEDGGVGWLDEAEPTDAGYEAFLAGVGSLVIGRTTFDQVLGWGWTYGGRPAAIVTRSELPEGSPPSAFACTVDELPGAVERLKREAEGDVWVVGGGLTAGAVLDAGLLDEVELAVFPVLLGKGIPVWPEEGTATHRLELLRTEQLAGGVVLLHHRVRR